MTDARRTYQIRTLVERRMLLPLKPGALQYTIAFANNNLMRGVIATLAAEGFVSDPLAGPTAWREPTRNNGERKGAKNWRIFCSAGFRRSALTLAGRS